MSKSNSGKVNKGFVEISTEIPNRDDLWRDCPKREWYDEHYSQCIVEPIEVMQKLFTKEQLEGFLMGNIIKYCMRAGKKGSVKEDLDKAERYHNWLEEYREAGVINPREV